ncbi:MAG: YceI family protein [Bacteroidota bacterium]
MKKSILTLALAALGLLATATPPGKTATSLKINSKESTIKWHAKKVTGEHFGSVQFQTGEINVDQNKLTGGTFTMNMTTIDNTDLTGEWKSKLVGHLKSDDFFSVEKHPTAVLKIKSATPIAGAKASEGKDNYTIAADLTVKGITKEVQFPALVVINKGKVTAKADFNIDRTLYDIRYGSKSFFADIGDKAIDNDFNINVFIVAQ